MTLCRDSPAVGQVERDAGLDARPKTQVAQHAQADVQDGDDRHPHVEYHRELPRVLHLVFQRQHLGEEEEDGAAVFPCSSAPPAPRTEPGDPSWTRCTGDETLCSNLRPLGLARRAPSRVICALAKGPCALPGAVPTGAQHLRAMLPTPHPKAARLCPSQSLILFFPAMAVALFPLAASLYGQVSNRQDNKKRTHERKKKSRDNAPS